MASLTLLLAGCATTKPEFADESCCEVNAAVSLASSPFLVPHTTDYGTNKIHYVTAGKGNHTIVLVHCWSGHLGFWREQVPVLQDKARLVLLDLPGHGQSDKPEAAYTMDFFAGAVLAVMRDAHVNKATLVGHSMGVPVICRVFKQAPENVAALVSVDGALRRPPFTAEQSQQFLAPFRTPEYRTATTNMMATMFPTPGTEKLRDEVTADMLNTPQYVMAGAMEGMFATDQPDWDLKKVNVPVLVINTTNAMWNADYKAYVRSLSPKTDYREITGAGHWLMLEKPAEFNKDLVDMLRKFDLIAK